MTTLQQVWQVYKENGCETTVHRTVQAKLGSDSDASAVRAFLDELERLLGEQELLLLMLSIGLGGLYETQASFIGILLREEVLQPRMVDMLLEKLSEFSVEMDAQMMEKNIPKLILRELRWMDLVVDSQQLVGKLIGALPAFAPSLQRDIIYILPEIASDEDGLIVVDALLELIRSDAGLVVCCIEALGNFNVLNEQTATVVQCVLERLDSSPLSDLPAIVKYLVQEAPVTNIEDIVDQLREKLSSTLAFEDTPATRTGKFGNEEALILGSIVQGFYFREELLKVIIAKIQATGPTTTPLRLLDVWILIGAHSIPRHQDKMGKLVKKKVHSGVLSRDLMVQSVKSHANGLKSFFPSLLQLGSLLITQTSDEVCVAMGSLLYELLFEEFSSRASDESTGNQTVFYQGEVVSALLSHSLSRATATKHAALDTLLALVSPGVSFHDPGGQRAYSRSPSQRRNRLRVFLPALKQMLDTMENCSAEEVRKIYDILFGIGGPEDPDLCNTLRKQAYHQDTRYRCFGIIAAVSRMKRLLTFFRENSVAGEVFSKSENDSHESSQLTQSSQSVVTFSGAQVAKALNRALMELHGSCLSHPKCLSFVLRELELLVTHVEQDQKGGMLVEIISDYYTEVLLNRFMDDFDVKKKHDGTYSKIVLDGAMKTDLWVGLDDKLSPVYLKILDLVVSPHLSDQQSLVFLSPLIALLLSCARTKKQLADIECVLVCPLQMVERSVLQDLSGMEPAAQNAVCSTLWHGINWIRSILNFFACEKKEYYAAKVAERLENLSLLESILLDEVLPSCPSFSPPGSSTIGMDSLSASAKSASDGKKKPGRPPGKKKLSGIEDRKLLIRQSFIAMRPEVVSILTSPRLQPRSGVSMDPLSQGTAQTLEVPLIQILFSLLEHHVQKSCSEEKKRKSLSAFWNKASGASKSEEILEHQSEVQSAPKLLQGFFESGVLAAAGRFAVHIFGVTESEQARGEPCQAGEEPTQTHPEHRLEECKSILVDYLHTVSAVLSYGIDTGESADPGPEPQKVQQLQALILQTHERAEYSGEDPELLQLIIKKCFKVIIRYHRVVGGNMDFAVALLKCLTSILSLGYGFEADHVLSKATSIDLNGWQQRRANLTSAIAAKISSLAQSFLQKDWSGGDAKFVYKNAHLEVFLDGYLRHSAVALDSIQTLALDGFLEVLEHNGKQVENYPTLDKKTVGVYHKVMFSTLAAATSRLDILGGNSSSDVKFVFNYLTQAVLLFKLLVCMTKSFQKSMIVSSVLKVGRKFIEMILRVMPFFQDQFLLHSDRVIKLISELQVATRRMQVLCAHGKLIKDQSAASQVPMVKKLLEKLIYRSEELASANGVLDAYTTGVLKNRRIDGTTISKEELEAGSESESEENNSETEDEERNEEQEEEEGKSEEEAPRPATKKRAR